MQVKGPRFNSDIVRNDNKGKQALNTSAPTTDKVMDLTNKDNVQKEIATRDVSFIRVKEKEEDIFLDVTKMPREEKDALIADLKNKFSGAAKYDNFDPEAIFKLSASKPILDLAKLLPSVKFKLFLLKVRKMF